MRTTRTFAGLAAAALSAGTLLVVAPAASAADPAPTPTTTTCSTGQLPSEIKGRPAGFKAGLPDGYWIWRDSYGWHLRVTHDEKKTKKVFTGSITSSEKLRSVRFRTEAGDRFVRSADGRSAAFRFTNYGGVDGVDFAVGCSKDVTFRLYENGKAIDAALIHLGSADAHPAANVFTISRTATTS
jgi:hypothetical protein